MVCLSAWFGESGPTVRKDLGVRLLSITRLGHRRLVGGQLEVGRETANGPILTTVYLAYVAGEKPRQR